MAKKLNLEYTPEMIEDIKNAKPFDYEAHEEEIENYLSSKKIDRVYILKLVGAIANDDELGAAVRRYVLFNTKE